MLMSDMRIHEVTSLSIFVLSIFNCYTCKQLPVQPATRQHKHHQQEVHGLDCSLIIYRLHALPLKK